MVQRLIKYESLALAYPDLSATNSYNLINQFILVYIQSHVLLPLFHTVCPTSSASCW